MVGTARNDDNFCHVSCDFDSNKFDRGVEMTQPYIDDMSSLVSPPQASRNLQAPSSSIGRQPQTLRTAVPH